jgi:4-amino-4-deoxy-L-arabinose transferase-like glycosyltransferase
MEQTKHAPRRWSLVIGRYALLAAILLVGAYLRLTGLNWDEGQWIHPDEGHMRIISSVIKIPDSPSLYFDTHNSPLNCRNSGYRYSYGTLPLFLTRLTAEWLDRGCGESPHAMNQAVGELLIGSEDQACRPGDFTGVRSAQVGRALAALSDLGTLLLLYLLGRRLYGEPVGLLAAGLGALTAFSIQQAHFFSVDSMACFFTTLTAYFAVRAGQSSTSDGPSWLHFGLAGLSTGLATACKVSAALAALLVALAGLWWWTESVRARPSRSPLMPLSYLLPRLLFAALLALVAFRIAQPYAFEGPGFLGLRPSPEWFGRLAEIRNEQSGDVDFPPGRQWTNRAPILFPWLNVVFWGLGLPLGLAACAGWALAGLELLRGKRAHLLPWVWTSLTFLYQATRWVKAMRYFLSLYPFFVILAAYGLVQLCRGPAIRRRRLGQGLTAIVLAGTAVWACAVFTIYLRPNTRIAASRWIFANVPPGVTVANEHWDWGLPLRVDGHDPFGGMYDGLEMQHYDEDTPAKRTQLFDWLEQTDYIFIASNRLYASISRLPARYPLTTAYYRALFAGELGFELLADFTSRPAIGPLQFPDQETPYPLMPAAYVHQSQSIKIPLPPAEEAFSVYDHPRVLIFGKTPAYSRQLVESVLGAIDVEHAQHGLTPIQATADLYLLLQDSRLYAGLAVILLLGGVIYKKRERLARDE